ncbi:NAD(P)/FAD-dependent oxidoreductase [Amycolatopsis aidingensis]|uniref:NAD(P)/FAD-dependent oxidoreductase n=1 Tax=Amycolatopsis aidingensis TaxID=2842453 RepID=UPI001C0E3A0B|nr:FAD-binding oxidoreductase [Amycolatopsis aidingensis]
MPLDSSEAGRTYDVIVVGNGSLGLSLGLTLAREGLRVAVLGAPHRPWAASSAAGAMIGVFGEVTDPLLTNDYGRTKLDWAYQASKLWPDWLAQLSPDSDGRDLLTADGTVMLLNAVGVPGIDDDNYKAIRNTLLSYDEKFEDVDPSELEWIDAEATARPVQAMFIPSEHSVNASELLVRLESAFTAAGGTLIPELATRVDQRGDRVRGVELESGTVLCSDDVVLAAGAASQAVLDTVPELAARIPRLVSGYGVSALVETKDASNPRSVIRTPNRAFACGLHVVPRGNGQVYVGATNTLSMDPLETPPVADVLFLMNCANRQVHRGLAESGFRNILVGNRPVSLDGMPLLGATELDGLWMMTGTYRDGLTLSPLLAREMAALIRGEETSVDLTMFQPVRPPIQPFTRDEVVAAAVMHMLATGYEDGWNLPVEWPSTIEHHLREAYTRTADELDPTYTPPPEVLASLRVFPTLTKALREYYTASHLR